MNDQVSYQLENELAVSEFINVLTSSGLAERRPCSDLSIIKGMLENADVIVTARNRENRLVGVARAITDFHYCTYLSDLAVDIDYQRLGIGKKLIDQTHLFAGKKTTLILLAAPAAVDYYPRIGFEKHGSCWLRNQE